MHGCPRGPRRLYGSSSSSLLNTSLLAVRPLLPLFPGGRIRVSRSVRVSGVLTRHLADSHYSESVKTLSASLRVTRRVDPGARRPPAAVRICAAGGGAVLQDRAAAGAAGPRRHPRRPPGQAPPEVRATVDVRTQEAIGDGLKGQAAPEARHPRRPGAARVKIRTRKAVRDERYATVAAVPLGRA